MFETYVRKNHSPKKIIGERSTKVMARSKLKDIRCFISDFKPRIVEVTLENENWIDFMNEDINKIEKNSDYFVNISIIIRIILININLNITSSKSITKSIKISIKDYKRINNNYNFLYSLYLLTIIS